MEGNEGLCLSLSSLSLSLCLSVRSSHHRVSTVTAVNLPSVMDSCCQRCGDGATSPLLSVTAAGGGPPVGRGPEPVSGSQVDR